jgi:hypothetical protein
MIGALRVFFLLAALALAIVGATDGKEIEWPWMLAFMAACAADVLKGGKS